ncbi:hypothetical protein UFOVP776_10 [uncultured Caudovirales phage]|uniref:Uncharacterized protein n=1 Tax=uncultured Caudovirales phage TaxID=2100421 RepID=A0A6J5NXD1_9CAUD|nr:hypothetical protein UFOVP776_10 [uncultured Caudovirales phage]
MADSKISALPASTTPLAGTEVLPIVQSSATKQVSVANLTAGRSFDALGMALTSTDAGAAAAPLLDLYRNSASPAASDTIGEIEFNGQDSAGNKQQYAVIHASILSPTSTAETGQIHFETATGGASTEKMIIGTTNLVINDIGAVFNVRIEGDTDANLFYTDATNSRVGVGTISPAEKLDVVGNIKLTGNVVVASGQGIDFSATPNTGTSELFADYEEGTYTATITPETSGTITLSGSVDLLKYTKTGRVVTVTGRCSVSSVSSPVGGTIRLNLPFAISTSTEAESRIGGAISSYNNVTTVNYAIIGDSGSSSIDIYVNAATIAAGMSFSVSFSYCA